MPCSRIVEHRAVLAAADRQRPQVRYGRDGQGGHRLGQRVLADQFEATVPGRPERTRHCRTRNPCARPSARSAKSFGDCPDTRPTVTRSVNRTS